MYFIDQDGDGNWFIIPAKKRNDWLNWLDSDEYEFGEIPEWAKQLGGHPNLVEFGEYEIV